MANYTSNYNLEKPLVTERYDVGVFNGNADIIDGVMHDNAVHVQNTQDMIAPPFDTNTAYAIGDRVTYNNNLYQFTSAHAVGAWDSSEVTIVNISDAIGTGGGGSTVVPNPTGEAVGELTSIGIDGNKYSISGGGGAYTTTVLFTNGASGDTTFQLSSAYTNFDAIAIYYSHFDGQDSYEDVRTYPTSFLNSVSSTDEVLGFTNDAWYYYFSVYSTTEFRYVKSNAGYITDIIGIKYGSNSGGGGGGTSDYAQLSNLPQVNNTTLLGNKSAADLGLVGAVSGKGLSTNDYTNTDKAIVDGVTSALAGKADVGDIPTKTSDLTNDSGFITNLVNNLLNYYLKSETYSKAEVDALLQAITTLDIQAVAQLPTTNISTTTIYLVPKQDPQVPDIKDEYINLDGTTSGWELIGNTQIDLSNYVTTTDLTTALADYVTSEQFSKEFFIGTQAVWNSLTVSQKTEYTFAVITDDYDDNPVGNLNALTTADKSSCVGAINELNEKTGFQSFEVAVAGKQVEYGTAILDTNIDLTAYQPICIFEKPPQDAKLSYTFNATGSLLIVKNYTTPSYTIPSNVGNISILCAKK